MVKVRGYQQVQVELEIPESEVANAIMAVVHKKIGPIDDAGCDWCTTEDGRTCIGNEPNWCVSTDPAIACLVDAANILWHGEPLRLEPLEVPA